MEAGNRITSRRALLPQDHQVIDAIGLTVDEYYDFLDQCEYACRDRGKEYSHIPDVRCDPVTVAVVQIVVGVALTVASALLAPKPKSADEKRLEPINTGDKTGKAKFTPYNDFESVQELATLGTTVPLVYAGGDVGVRVNTQLLWSNIDTIRNGQIAKLLLLISQGELAGTPDFGGIAIGDTLLENYDRTRLRAWFRPGKNNSRPRRSVDAYRYRNGKGIGDLRGVHVPRDVFSLRNHKNGRYEPWFSGARTPSNGTQFGLYSTLPNGNHYKVNYELILVNDNAEKDVKEGQREKRNKIAEEYPIGAGIIRVGNKRIDKGSGSRASRKAYVREGDIVEYHIRSEGLNNGYKGGRWGVEDVINATAQRRYQADSALALGKIYRIGTASLVCIREPKDSWNLDEGAVTYKFRCIDRGTITFGGPKADQDNFKTYNPALISNGIITTNRPDDDMVEIGIKSTVWKQVSGFPNVNSQPNDKVIDQYSDGGGSITLGSMNMYLFRMSCFHVMARPIDEGGFVNLVRGTAFCVKNNNPSEVYNSFRIELPSAGSYKNGSEFEIKCQPVAGNYVLDKYKTVIILDTREPWRALTLNNRRDGRYRLWYRGYKETINIGTTSNPEFIIGSEDDVGQVNKLKPSQGGKIPDSEDKEESETRYAYSFGRDNYDKEYYVEQDGKKWKFVWENERIKKKKSRRKPGKFKRKIDGRYYYFKVGERKTEIRGAKLYEIKRYRISADEAKKQSFTIAPSGGSGSGCRIKFTRYSNKAWEARIVKKGKGYRNGERVRLRAADGVKDVYVKLYTNNDDIFKVNPYDMLKDYPTYDAESFSNDSSPEHEISYVNEVREVDAIEPEYDDMAVLGLWITSSTDITNISQVSLYVNKGIKGRKWVGNSSYGAIHYLPEVIFDLLTNTEYGVGGIIGRRGIDEGVMSRTTRYCRANGFYWDGVIKDKINVRQWIFEQAAYVMCDFCIQGGKFFIKPSFPVHKDYRIHKRRREQKEDTVAVKIKALFTDGNTREAKVSFLPPEERQMFTAQVIYRHEEINGFSELASKTVRLDKNPEIGETGGSDSDPIERFDLSSFCTSETHASKFARYALRLRQLVTHTVQFQTTPESCRNLSPGDFVRYISTVTHLDRFATGSITDTGVVQCHRPPSQIDNQRIMYWRVGSNAGVRGAKLRVNSNGRCNDTNLQNSVFALTNTETRSRIYKVESLQYTDDGLVDLTLNEAPVDSRNRLLVLDWRDDDFFEYD